MDTVAAFFPVARPRGLASLFPTTDDSGRSRLAEAVALAFAIRDAGPLPAALHSLSPAAAAAVC